VSEWTELAKQLRNDAEDLLVVGFAAKAGARKRAAAALERAGRIADAAKQLIEYEEDGAPDFLDWDSRFDALKAALAPEGGRP